MAPNGWYSDILTRNENDVRKRENDKKKTMKQKASENKTRTLTTDADDVRDKHTTIITETDKAFK